MWQKKVGQQNILERFGPSKTPEERCDRIVLPLSARLAGGTNSPCGNEWRSTKDRARRSRVI